MATVTAPTSTLQAIQTKVRRLTRSPSQAQLTDADLQNYINTFVVYDFPEHLRTFNLRTTFNFVCNAYQDVYPTDIESFVGVTTNPLYDFQNKYLTVHPPFYIAGYQSFYTQNRESFYGIYPFITNIYSIGSTGNGITQSFTGKVANAAGGSVLLQNNVLFSSVDAVGQGIALQDVPITDTVSGNLTIFGNLYVPGTQPTTPITNADFDPTNNINYVTGEFTITFSSPPGAGRTINSQTVQTLVSLPQAICYYDNKFILRPVPDQPYSINFEAYVSPTYLMQTTDEPALKEWWQLIAYGSSIKILQDRMDIDSVNLIMPEFKQQLLLCLRRTIVQLTNERVSTIYTQQTDPGRGYGSWGWGGEF
jgi:hypothetical protein